MTVTGSKRGRPHLTHGQAACDKCPCDQKQLYHAHLSRQKAAARASSVVSQPTRSFSMTSAMPAGRNGVSSWLWQLKCTRPPVVPQRNVSYCICNAEEGTVSAGDSFWAE